MTRARAPRDGLVLVVIDLHGRDEMRMQHLCVAPADQLATIAAVMAAVLLHRTDRAFTNR
jgi:hypothetical protein